MTTPVDNTALDTQIDQWRTFLRRRQAIHAVDVEELEDHLREQIAGLMAAGLAADEAFLVAVKRMGNLDALSREFAREHSHRLWKQLLVTAPPGGAAAESSREAFVAFGLALAAALAVKLPVLFGITMQEHELFYLRNFPLFVLPLLAAYFVWKRPRDGRTPWILAAGFIAAAVFANAYSFAHNAHTFVLQVLHLPIALWLLIGIAYAGRRWSDSDGRMDFIRYTGELVIYFVLIALGGGVLTGLMAMAFTAIGVEVEPFIGTWVIPCGAAGAVLVASWLVEAKQGVIENMAPVLTRLFAPLFALALLLFLGTLVVTGRGIDIERNVLIGFDLLLVVVIGLLLYSASARDPQARPDLFDYVQVVLIVSALLADAVMLWAIAARISEFGISPNRIAALGENIILLVNLAWSAVLYVRFLRGQSPFRSLERWQTAYLPVYAAWAAIVVIAFPPLFGFT